ncbi:hypothetical protein TNIN_22081 [Trichonephila inaurata madagascariensis]|uniref:Uncharacterized protein n=1 Tax=Trichonephila inaurata madagascariensis TaxID=2747483 RepID=A0A8X7CDV8_9ARAC|nr:hypothetical protein TNIN_22081 [Trichonephila inaurata madagascariensis]
MYLKHRKNRGNPKPSHSETETEISFLRNISRVGNILAMQPETAVISRGRVRTLLWDAGRDPGAPGVLSSTIPNALAFPFLQEVVEEQFRT